MIIALVEGPVAPGATIELPADELRHLKVRRITHGRVQLRDGRGFIGEGSLEREGHNVFVTVEEAASVPPPPPLILGVGAGDRERFASVVEKSAELGVTRLVPLETERTAGVATRVRDDQLARLRRRSLEAIKQSGAAWAPHLDEVTPLAAFIGRAARDGHLSAATMWLADSDGNPPPAALAPGAPIVVIIGPEGGLTAEERSATVGGGYVPTWLGPHVLRFETAAIAAAAAAVVARRRGSS